MNARRVEVTEDMATTVPNIEAIVQDFRVVGEGLVHKVELRTERWVVWIVKIFQKFVCHLKKKGHYLLCIFQVIWATVTRMSECGFLWKDVQ